MGRAGRHRGAPKTGSGCHIIFAADRRDPYSTDATDPVAAPRRSSLLRICADLVGAFACVVRARRRQIGGDGQGDASTRHSGVTGGDVLVAGRRRSCPNSSPSSTLPSVFASHLSSLSFSSALLFSPKHRRIRRLQPLAFVSFLTSLLFSTGE